jgi:hypothetical protein
MRWLIIAVMLTACSRVPEVRVTILQPSEGAEVAGPSVDVVLETEGIEIAPVAEERDGTAHHHLFVDHDLTPLDQPIPSGQAGILHLGGGQTRVTLENLAPGPHRIIAVLADWHHVPLKPAVADTVHFTVTQ